MDVFGSTPFVEQRAAGDRSPRRSRPMQYETALAAPDVSKRLTYESRNPFPRVYPGDVVATSAGSYQRRRTSTYEGAFETVLGDVGEGATRLFAIGPHDAAAAAAAAHAPANETQAHGGERITSPSLRRTLVDRGQASPTQVQTAILALGRYVMAQGLSMKTAADVQAFRGTLSDVTSRIVAQDWAAVQRLTEEESTDNVDGRIREP